MIDEGQQVGSSLQGDMTQAGKVKVRPDSVICLGMTTHKQMNWISNLSVTVMTPHDHGNLERKSIDKFAVAGRHSNKQQEAKKSHLQPQAGSGEWTRSRQGFLVTKPTFSDRLLPARLCLLNLASSINNCHQVFNYWNLRETALIQTTVQTNRQTLDSCFSLHKPEDSPDFSLERFSLSLSLKLVLEHLKLFVLAWLLDLFFLKV